jgi:cyclic 2,3-diphosphoglycerate synthase
VLADGEHHPPVVRRALDRLQADGLDVVGVVVLGGGEKTAEPGVPPDLGAPARWPENAESALPAIIAETHPDVAVDLSGEPVVTARRRLELAAVCLALGVGYEAPGLRYDPPDLPPLATRPAVAVVATGKRTGKTAVSGTLARHAMAQGRVPVVVAMGRGGPPDPVVIPAGETLTPERLAEVAASGQHAASDFYEDAVTTGAATVGSYRVGDGPAGAVAVSNVASGVAEAERLAGDLLVLEGSGAALPPRPGAAPARGGPAPRPAGGVGGAPPGAGRPAPPRPAPHHDRLEVALRGHRPGPPHVVVAQVEGWR